MRIGSLFSGIDGLALGLERAGLGHTVWQVENDPNASSVLASHWPGVPNFDDVTLVDWSKVEQVDVLCGGFPCQPSSSSGKRKGRADERWLWPEMARAIRELRPGAVVAENVPGLLSVDDGAGFSEVLGDFAALGYTAVWGLLGAWRVGGCHRRDRVFIVAFSDLDPPWHGNPLANFADGHFLRRQTSLFGDEVVDEWPRSGVLRAGTVEVLSASPWQTDTTNAGVYLPTPTVGDGEGGGAVPTSMEATRQARGDGGASSLRDVVKLLPTPQTAYTSTSVEEWKSRRPAGNGQQRETVGDLGLAVKLLPTPEASDGEHAGHAKLYLDPAHSNDLNDAVLLLPTPQASDGTGGRQNKAASGARPSGAKASLSLQAVIDHLLPTPRTTGANGAGPRGDGGADLRATVALLPTPTATDANGGRNSTATRASYDGVHIGDTLSDIAYADRFGEFAPALERWAAVFGEEPPDPTEIGPKGGRRLSANFVRWMQGFDPGWCDGLSRASALRCYGNAVLPQAAYVIGGYVATLLRGSEQRGVEVAVGSDGSGEVS